jgi:hypothetical protein
VLGDDAIEEMSALSNPGQREARPAVWTMPLVLAVSTVLGLLSGLLGDDAWDLVSWLALGLLPVMIAWQLIHTRSNSRG